ncbi:MAG: hypothetical protein CMJ78_09005 [Planctomycetaceae bacterium]|nr:hypothetical protein [Planctomycetaceae bacterium]
MNSESPNTYASSRDWNFPEYFDLAQTPALSAAWERSHAVIADMRQRLEGAAIEGLATIAASGSVGRMEMLEHSDVDLIVVLDDSIELHAAETREIYEAVWMSLVPLDLKRPRDGGIYGSPTNCRELCDPSTIGKIEDDPSVFGKRIQLLLDSQPVVFPENLKMATDRIVERYATGIRQHPPSRNWHYLLNDLTRYYRSLCVYYEWDQRDRPAKWRLRNTKLRYSRLINHAGLLLLLAESISKGPVDLDWFRMQLSLTPLERIASVFSKCESSDFNAIAARYDRFLSQMSDKNFRERHESDDGSTYQKITESARELSSTLLRFLLSNQNRWSERFFESLIF